MSEANVDKRPSITRMAEMSFLRSQNILRDGFLAVAAANEASKQLFLKASNQASRAAAEK